MERPVFSAPQPGWVYVIDYGFLRQDPAYNALFLRKNSWLEQLTPTGDVAGIYYYYEIPGESRPDNSRTINSFPYYVNGVQPYHPKPIQVPLQLEY